jgi:ABC-type lipoprotein release transport system permease subunit
MRLLMARPAVLQLALGLALGMPAALTVNQLPFMGPRDAVTLGSIVVVLATTALVACVLPLERALRLDPLAVLRDE